jgi:NAD(P)-dependent dehydrogenase (short-subunit alcohol dehydrogenase family)
MTTLLFDLKHKTALITGGNGGIGLGLAKGIAKQGGNVCIWGRDKKKNQIAIQELSEFEGTFYSIVMDVADEGAVSEAFSETLSVFGRIDGCFANAGVGKRDTFHEQNIESWRRVYEVNLDGLFFTLRAAAKHMKERAERGDYGGRLVGVSSIGARFGMAKSQAYAGSKGAVISIMQGLAVEYARYGVTANSILPGHIETAMTAKSLENEKFVNAIIPRIPSRRFGTPDDFEAIAAYLMSDSSNYHSGDCFTIDGGFSMF